MAIVKKQDEWSMFSMTAIYVSANILQYYNTDSTRLDDGQASTRTGTYTTTMIPVQQVR